MCGYGMLGMSDRYYFQTVPLLGLLYFSLRPSLGTFAAAIAHVVVLLAARFARLFLRMSLWLSMEQGRQAVCRTAYLWITRA